MYKNFPYKILHEKGMFHVSRGGFKIAQIQREWGTQEKMKGVAEGRCLEWNENLFKNRAAGQKHTRNLNELKKVCSNCLILLALYILVYFFR